MLEILSKLFSTDGFMPHGHCYLWQPGIVWLHVLSDTIIALSYLTIPLTLTYFVRARRDLPFARLFVAFGLFIVSCGMTHVMEIWTLWTPLYWLSGAIKAVTAVASVTTAALLVKLVPRALALPGPSELRLAHDESKRIEARFRAAAEGMIDGFFILEAVRDDAGKIRDFRVVEANATTARRLGADRARLVGALLSEVVPLDRFDRAFERYAEAVETRKALIEEIEIPENSSAARPAQVRWLHLQIVPLEDGVAVTSRDVTVRRRAESLLLGRMREGVCIARAEGGEIVFANENFERLLGYGSRELEGKPMSITYFASTPGEAEDRAEEVMREAQARGEITYEVKNVKRSGELVWCRATTTELDHPEYGRVLVSVQGDITEAKKAEEQMARLASIVESTDDAIIGKNRDGVIETWNAGAEQLYGYTAAEAVGRLVTIVVPEELVEEDRDMLARVHRGEHVEPFDTVRVRKDGTRIDVCLATSPIRDPRGEIIGVSTTARDIWQRKRDERLLHASLREKQQLLEEQKLLEAQLQRKNDELEAQNRRVQEATRLKSEFLANMSHELRTPLNGIIGFSELMHDGRVGAISAPHKEYLGDILTSARHLLQLINDVLDLAKIESGKMEFRPERVDLSKLAGEVRNVVRPLASSKRIRVEIAVAEGLGDVFVDPARLKQVLYNYLSNALKFTSEGGTVTIRVEAEGTSKVRLAVEDNGIGIAPEDVARLFVEFQQLDGSAGKKYQGTGLGLALTRQIIEAQGGRVGVDSAPGKGSTFFAVFPRKPASGTIAAMVRPSDRRSDRPDAPVVLVVENDPTQSDWIARKLCDAGYSVQVALTGAEAVQRSRHGFVDAMMLDLLLPDMSGWDVLHAVRAESLNPDVATIISTPTAKKEAAVGFAVEDFLLLPVQPAELLAALARVHIPPNTGRSVLLVGDDPAVQELVLPRLEDAGYAVRCAADAHAGLRAAASDRPQVIVLDLLLPGMGGLAFIEHLRRSAEGRRIPVILWTAKDPSPEDRVRLQALARATFYEGEGSTAALLAELDVQLRRRRRGRPEVNHHGG